MFTSERSDDETTQGTEKASNICVMVQIVMKAEMGENTRSAEDQTPPPPLREGIEITMTITVFYLDFI